MMRRLVIALIVMASLTPASPTRAQGDPAPLTAFDAFWSLYDERYALFQVKRADWVAVRDVYRAGIHPEMSRTELFDVFARAVAHLNDAHVTVRDDRTGRAFRSGRARSDAAGEFSLDLVARNYAPDGLQSRAAGLIRFGRLSQGVGYVHLAAFRHATASEEAIDDAIAAMNDAPVMIVDVRDNSGGRDSIGRSVAARFSDMERLYMTVENRLSDGDHDAFAPPVEWRLAPPTSGGFTGEVIVLTNGRTISAAENFVLAMRAIPKAVIVGDITAGAMADVVTVSLAGDWTFTVPVNVMRDLDGVSWEGVGLAPDLWARNTTTDIEAGGDPVLELAIAIATARQRSQP